MKHTIAAAMSTAQYHGRAASIRRWITGAILLATVALWPSVTRAQGTLIPFVTQYFNDASGNPVNNGKLCTYAAGSSTPLATYSDVTLMTANANPVRTSSNGRPTTGAIYLTPGQSYKFVLYTAGSDNTCSTGTLLWSLDNVAAIPSSSGNVDVTGIAGEALSAGDAVYLSQGIGGTTSGRWYKTDSDFTYASMTAAVTGIAPSAIASGASGSIRLIGRVTGLSGLTAGGDYYVSGTAGGVTATAPTNALRLGRAESTTVLILRPADVRAPRGPPNGRLTLETGVCVSSSDQTAKTTLYYTPCGGGNEIDLFDGSQWVTYAFAEISIAVPATTVTLYDVFAYANAGVVTLELTAWTNGTTRATALAKQDGVLVKTGALTRRYLGSFRTTGVSGQTEDSATKRFVWNYYHRVRRSLVKAYPDATWTYTTATLRQANANAANQVEVVVGVAEDAIDVAVQAAFRNSTVGVEVYASIGIDSTSSDTGTQIVGFGTSYVASLIVEMHARYQAVPAVGYHFYAGLEWSTATGTSTWLGTTSPIKSGLSGFIWG